MTAAQPGGPLAGPIRPAGGLSLLGEYQGTGFAEPRYLVRRDDGQVIQLSRLLYLVVSAVAQDGAGDGTGPDAAAIAERAGASLGRDITADNIRYLVTAKLIPLGVVTAGEPGPRAQQAAPPAPRVNQLASLRVRGVLLRPGAAAAVGRALAWLHFPPLAGVVLAGFAAFETWLLAGHGAIGPLLAVLQRPVLFLAVAGLTLASLLFHEFGHASACRRGGARPGAIGFGLYLVWPSLYTDVTDIYRLSRAGRLRTDLGGVYFNAIFILFLGGCYAVTGQPVFLAAAFLDNFQILQQLVPLVRMDGYFILGDLAGVPDLIGLIVPIMASLLPGRAARRAGARAGQLRRGPRILVTAWVTIAVPLLAAAAGYTLWNLPVLTSAAVRSVAGGVTAARAGFAGGRVAGGLADVLSVALVIIPLAGLAYLLARITGRGTAAAVRLARRGGRRRAATLTALGAAVAAAAAAVIAAGPGLRGPAPQAAVTAQSSAVAWVTRQVSPDVIVSCDPGTCGALRRGGFPAARLMPLQKTALDPLGSGLVVATPSLRRQLGTQLDADYAPLVIAGFGAGAQRVEVRAVAPAGIPAFRSGLSSARASLVSAGRQLAGNMNIRASPGARAGLRAGRADARLCGSLSALAAQLPIRLVRLTDASPGAGTAVPLRGAQIGAGSRAALSEVLAFLRAQQGPFRPASAELARDAAGQPVISVRFDAPGLSGVGSG